jgi:hypothetical protein
MNIEQTKRDDLVMGLEEAGAAADIMAEVFKSPDPVDPVNARAALSEFVVGARHLVEVLTGPPTTLHVELELPGDYLANVICSGIESGIAYWSSEVEFSNVPFPGIDELMQRYHQPLAERGFIRIRERSDQRNSGRRRDGWHVLDRAALIRAVKVIVEKYPHHAGAVLGDQSKQDATTGDVLIQCAIFGEIFYG